MGMEKVSHIANGFTGWVEVGFAVEDYETWKASQA